MKTATNEYLLTNLLFMIWFISHMVGVQSKSICFVYPTLYIIEISQVINNVVLGMTENGTGTLFKFFEENN